VLSLQRPHILLLDEVSSALLPLFWAAHDNFSLRKPTNHLDMKGLDGLMLALSSWNGGVIVISHDERFITSVAKEVRGRCFPLSLPLMRSTPIRPWVCGDGTITKFKGDVEAYKVRGRIYCDIRSLTVLKKLQSLIVSNIKAKP